MDYQWTSKTKTRPGRWYGFANHKTQVEDPSIKEPYFIEGPSEGPTWEWIKGLGVGYGGFVADKLTQRYPKSRRPFARRVVLGDNGVKDIGTK
ncbi:hypothetical protein ABW20_dc0107488 [Dactylellina cionopaga]|nr:hypothetical protein ABW20_dc0107488 [Dactylellina cionopaga]